MTYNPIKRYPLDPVIKIPQSVTLNDGTTIEVRNVLSNVQCSKKEMEYYEWVTNHPDFEDEERQDFINDTVSINSWNDYAFQISDGKLNSHLCGLTVVPNRKLSIYSKCLHNEFGGVSECIQKLNKVLYGSPINFRKFMGYKTPSNLCYHCVMCFSSTIKNVERLFNEYHKQCTNWNTSDERGLLSTKELYYLSHTLLTYHCFVKYVLRNDLLYTKIFSLYVYYFKNFSKLKDHIKRSNRQIFMYNDQGYVITSNGINTMFLFEYNLNGILSCMRKLMPHFKTKHFLKLLEMNYFKYFMEFIEQLFALKYMKLLTDSIIPGKNIEIRGTCTLFSALSVFRFICNRLINKISIKDLKNNNLKKKLKKIMIKTNETNNAISKLNAGNNYFNIAYFEQFWLNRRYLKDKYKYILMTSVVCQKEEWNISNILKKKSRQVKKDKLCGNSNCLMKTYHFKQFKLCAQCKIVIYCSRKCQKNDWIHHRVFCKLFI